MPSKQANLQVQLAKLATVSVLEMSSIDHCHYYCCKLVVVKLCHCARCSYKCNVLYYICHLLLIITVDDIFVFAIIILCVQEVCGWINEKASIPVWAKMTPNITDITFPARTALNAGCEGVAAINTIQSVMGVNLKTLRPEPSVEGYSTPGGYSSVAVKPIALAKVKYCVRCTACIHVSVLQASFLVAAASFLAHILRKVCELLCLRRLFSKRESSTVMLLCKA